MVIGGIIAGVFSATEGSAIAVVYALILGICYRNITWKKFWNIVVESAKMSGMVVFLIGVSNILGWVMAFLQIPQAVSAALLGITDNPRDHPAHHERDPADRGHLHDVTPAILIFTPLFLPIVQTFGMNPIHFGLVLVYNLCIGNITPACGQHPVRGHQGGPHHPWPRPCPICCLLRGHSGRPDAGDVYPGPSA